MAFPTTSGPNPDTPFPLEGQKRVGFLKNFLTRPNIVVGDYTYYDDPEGPENFERNVLYHFDFLGDTLRIGKFCALATGVRFLMNGANHDTGAFSTFPFGIFGHGWEAGLHSLAAIPSRGDTVVGNDVWIGYDSLILPGVRIGDGAIVAARSVVTGDVAPYAVVGGNPARTIRQRFPDAVAAKLLALKWWDWPVEKITRHVGLLSGSDVAALLALPEGEDA